ncbi:MAG: hypothetical protein PW789_18200 [Edaphobacter sp.]|uniref:hypothetical protein n=1 Tax=Edaphobacter sp. TaxID=1934404 RepID=UPI00238B0B45|nr:hypothetical protein [Edaphobacter sp.]MDE1178509.1 hypothetical protein [Edaphobacter sp.]
MKRVSLLSSIAALLICTAALAQENGNWRAANQTAKSITGDIAITPEKLYINFARFTMSRIRPLKSDEVAAAFETETAAAGAGSLYRISIPPETKFLHKNTLCGTEETQWVATYSDGKNLKVAFFSDAKPPVFTIDALQNSTNLCGTFSYVR